MDAAALKLAFPHRFAARGARGSGAGGPRRRTLASVNRMLREFGVNAEESSLCVRAGIVRGHLRLESRDDLDATAYDGECGICGGGCRARISLREALSQTDNGYYSEGPVTCGSGYDVFLTNACSGRMSLGGGKWQNHCRECKGLGKCLGDGRMSHCADCGRHWFEGNSGFPCSYCNPGDEPECSVM